MTQTISNAVSTRANAGNAVIEQYRSIFAEVLPSHVKPETWVRVAQGALRRNPDLAVAAANNPQSLVAALLDAARLGLEPGTEQFYLVPMSGEVNGWTGYQGEIELIYRAGAVSSVVAEVVHVADKFHYKPGMPYPDHEIDWDLEDRGELRLAYAYAVMKDGTTSRPIVMPKSMVMRHKAMSRGSDRADSPWKKWPESMWLKTAVHELAKWVPTSAEYLRDQARAAGEMIRHATKPTSAPPSQAGPQSLTSDEPVRAHVIQGEAVETPPPNGGRLSTDKQRQEIGILAGQMDLDRDSRLAYLSDITGRKVASSKELTTREAAQAIAKMRAFVNQSDPSGGTS